MTTREQLAGLRERQILEHVFASGERVEIAYGPVNPDYAGGQAPSFSQPWLRWPGSNGWESHGRSLLKIHELLCQSDTLEEFLVFGNIR